MRLGAARAGGSPASASQAASVAARPTASSWISAATRASALTPRGETRQKHSAPLELLSCSAACWQTPIAQTLGRGRDKA